jgi:hypothetical protein
MRQPTPSSTWSPPRGSWRRPPSILTLNVSQYQG